MSINDKPTTDVTESQSNDTVDEFQMPDELTVLKERAKLMGVQHSPNIGVEALRKKISDAQEGKQPEQEQATTNPFGAIVDTDEPTPVVREMSLPQKIRAEQTRLVRVRIQNLDPKKKDLPGEIITVANEYMGTVRKYVPYGEATDGGYHVPYCIYEFLRNRKFLNIRVGKRNGQPYVESSYVREFSIELMPPLTREELNQLAQAQIAAGSLNDN